MYVSRAQSEMPTGASWFCSTAHVLCLTPRSVRGLWVRCNSCPNKIHQDNCSLGKKSFFTFGDDRTQPQSRRFDHKPVQTAGITRWLRATQTSLLPSNTAKVVDNGGPWPGGTTLNPTSLPAASLPGAGLRPGSGGVQGRTSSGSPVRCSGSWCPSGRGAAPR